MPIGGAQPLALSFFILFPLRRRDTAVAILVVSCRPGSCCPSLTALLSAMAKDSTLSLEGLDNMCFHYAHTLKQWRHRFNQNLDQVGEMAVVHFEQQQ